MAMTEEDVLAVVDVLEERAIPVSVAGGWAVDALVGRVTREHGDLDLAIDTTLVDRAIGVLGRIGLRVDLDERPARLTLGDGRRAVDLHPVAWGSDGTGIQDGFGRRALHLPARLDRCCRPHRWPHGALPHATAAHRIPPGL